MVNNNNYYYYYYYFYAFVNFKFAGLDGNLKPSNLWVRIYLFL